MSRSCLPLTHCSRRKSFGGFSKILKQLEALFNEIWYRISVVFFPIILRIQSRSRDIRLKCLQGSSLEGGLWVRLSWDQRCPLIRWVALHWESLYLSHPAAVSKKKVSGSLIHPLMGADTSGKSCFSVTLLIRLFLERSISICSYQDAHGLQNSCVRNAVDNPLLFTTQDFSIILILTSTSQPGLLPLIARVPWSLPCLQGSSSVPLSGCCTITDTKPQDYLVTLPCFYFVCLQASQSGWY